MFFERMKKRLSPGQEDTVVPVRTDKHTQQPAAMPVHYTGSVPGSLEEISANDRAEARERRRFLALVEMNKGMGAKAACEFVAGHHADEFPILSEGGNGGRSQLTYHSYRNWRQILLAARKEHGGELTEEHEVRLLAKRYARGERGSTADPEFLELFRKFYLNRNCPKVPAAYRNAVMAWAKIGNGRPAGTIGQCRVELQRIAPEVIVRAREGDVAWRNKCCDYITRNWNDIAAGDVAVGDSRPFDTRVKVWNDRTERWESARPTIAALLDARSWKFVAYWITTEPVNSDTLINTLALWCHNTGGIPPTLCYFDNGKDYNAAGFSTPLTVGQYDHSIFKELGIKLLNATAYNGRAKTIERAFRDMMRNFDKLFQDYLGSSPAERSDASSYYDSHPEELPSLNAFCKVFAAWLTQYHTTAKHGKIHGGESPDTIWDRRAIDSSRRRTPEDLMLAFLRPLGLRQVGRGGQIQVDGTYYVTDDVRWGEKVLVKRSSFDDSFVMLYTADGRRLGIARSREAVKAIAEGRSDRELLAERIARQKKQDRAARTMLADLTGGVYGASPLEVLLTAGTDAEFRVTGKMHLVKGGTHDFKLIEGGGMAQLESEEVKKTGFAESEKAGRKNMTGFAESEKVCEDSAPEIAACDNEMKFTQGEDPEEGDQADMEEIYNFITKKHQGEEDDE